MELPGWKPKASTSAGEQVPRQPGPRLQQGPHGLRSGPLLGQHVLGAPGGLGVHGPPAGQPALPGRQEAAALGSVAASMASAWFPEARGLILPPSTLPSRLMQQWLSWMTLICEMLVYEPHTLSREQDKAERTVPTPEWSRARCDDTS